MQNQLNDKKYDLVSSGDKTFILAFDNAMKKIGYESDGIKPYACWGKYVIAYSKAGNKTKKYIARFYFRDDCILFRLYFTKLDKHRESLENAPAFIKSVFTSEAGQCSHCSNNCKDENGNCSHRKTYTVDGITYEKCDGLVFIFPNHEVDSIPQYMKLIETFHLPKKARRT